VIFRIFSLRVLATALAIVALAGFGSPTLASLSLVWSDEFEGNSLDTDNWTIEIGNGCPDLCGWGNNELEYYRAENVAVTDGNLYLTAREEYYGGNFFTSGKIHSRNKQVFLYGRMEMRAKIPTGGGMWPAFWMMPEDDVYGGWAASGEIDIMEAVNETTEVHGTIHFGGSWPDNIYSGGSYSLGGENFADEFHVYAVEWEADQIRWYVDGIHYYTKYSWQWHTDGDPGNPLAPFDQEFYLILNAAVGGNMPGCTSPSCITADLPQHYIVDYVRVYQETANSAPTVTITSPTEGDNPPAGDITIEVDASDADGSVATVEFYEGTTYLGEDDTAPFSLLWTGVADGCFEILAKAIDDNGAFGTDGADITVGSGCGQAPFHGSPFALPTLIEAEDFDIGGEGVAYHDTDSGNNGSQYRLAEDVDIQTCTDDGGGYNLGWILTGEWLEYSVSAPVSGEYPIELRVASLSQGGTFHIEFDGEDKTGDVAVPVTGGWQNWTTVATTATLSAGNHVMRFVTTDEGFNLNSIDLLEATAASDLLPPTLALRPCHPNPFNPMTTISYELPGPGTVNLSIYDVTGKRIKRLVDGEAVEAGRHEVVWNGSNDTGRVVAAGVYLCRLDVGGRSETRRMTLMK
jgi:beta-glucanase (GH16 family)